MRALLLKLRKAIDAKHRAGIAEGLAELVLEAYSTAVAHEIRLDEAIKEVHREHMDRIEKPQRAVAANMSRAIAKSEGFSLTWMDL